MNTVILKTGKEHSVLRRHPWIFSGAIGKVEGGPANGETVRILDSKKNFLGCGAWSNASSIAVRIWSF
ncbi:MAG: 23S rRNA (cytosine(1962)-C(5))-methyltransferase RlmI, partial [Lentisphaeria bacterium]|nr:23S rRNA (cytosine(1962)-C(5))-methyltransferase RlmI [Lentisphaeria bacterium]